MFINNVNLVNFWIESSDEDYNVMNVLYRNHKNSWCLFIGHIVIEKLMKLKRKIDTRIEPHLIRVDDYKKVDTPFIKEVIDTGIKIA